MEIRDAVEADAGRLADLADSPPDVMRNLVHDRTVRVATEDDDGQIVASFNESFQNRTAYSVFAGGYAAPEDAPTNESLALFNQIDVTDNPEIPGATGQAANETADT